MIELVAALVRWLVGCVCARGWIACAPDAAAEQRSGIKTPEGFELIWKACRRCGSSVIIRLEREDGTWREA